MSRAAWRLAGRSAAAAALAAALAVVASCGQSRRDPSQAPPDPPLETVEVGDALDAELDTSEDVVAARRPREDVGGVLPGGFPRDLPLPTPTTLVDFGDATGGGAWVLLASPRSAAALSSQLAQDLPAAGWRLSAAGPPWTAARDGRSVRIAVTARGAGSELKIEY